MNEKDRTLKKNLWMYPLGTIGRDMIYALFNSFILTYILLTRQLDNAQLAAVTAIMIGARIFDAVNDPIMGFIIEKAFQHGGDFLRSKGFRYEALATVESLDDCKIVLK